MKRSHALLLLAAAWPAAIAWSDALETITLHYRLAEDLIPVLQPLMPAGAAITGAGSVLLVRAEPAALEQVRQAVAALDRAPRQLLISVGQETGTGSQRAGASASGTIGSGNVQVSVNDPRAAQDGARVVLHGSDQRDRIRSVSSVRALEGYEAYVATGESRPFTSGSVTRVSPGGVVVSESTGYRDVLSGFYATPRLSGDRVTLQISPQQSQVAPGRRDAVSVQSVTTTVSGKLGEWIPVGSASDKSDSRTTGLATWGTRSELTQYTVWVKVDEVP